MKQLLIQALNLMRQNRFYAVVSIVGTAVTIAFVMVVIMIYDFRTTDIAPETDRDRLMYVGSEAYTSRKLDGTNGNGGGIGRLAYETLFTRLDGVEDITWYCGVAKTPCSLLASNEIYNYYIRSVAANWFSFYEYEFIAGRSFTQEEYDAQRRVAVISERMARQLFGTEDVVGKEFMMNFNPVKIVGVIHNVSAIFQTAYADCFSPFSLVNEDHFNPWTLGLGGGRLVVLKLSVAGNSEAVSKEVQRRENQLNESANEYKLVLGKLYTHTEYTFFRGKDISAPLVYSLLVLILLIVPAINIAGLTHTQMQGRLSEIAVRKVYGASNVSVISHMFGENLFATLFGGVFGYLLSCLLLWLGRTWMLGSGGIELSGITLEGGMMLRPSLFFLVFGVCIVFNLLSVLLPAWMATRRGIVSTIKGE